MSFELQFEKDYSDENRAHSNDKRYDYDNAVIIFVSDRPHLETTEKEFSNAGNAPTNASQSINLSQSEFPSRTKTFLFGNV